MLCIQVNHITKSFGDRVVLQDITFQINKGERVGLVGRNGQGKTTLFRILLQEEESDEGGFSIEGRIGYLCQQAQDCDGTVKDFFMNDGVQKYEMKKAMKQVGLPESLIASRMADLSGGERTRIRMARVLLSNPEVLMLDEPTNHLDITAIQWLEGFLHDFGGTVLVISHDRYFLDRVVSKVLELEDGRVTEYAGSYSDYARAKKEQLEKQHQEYQDYMSERRRLEETIRKKLQRAQSMEKVRRPRDSFQAREGTDFYKAKASRVSQNAKAIEKRLEKLDKKEKPREYKNIHLSLDTNHPVIAKTLAEGTALTKAFGSRHLFHEADFCISRGSRIALMGDNGVGKTTLIRMILGDIQADRGEIRVAPSVDIGYLDQELNHLVDSRSILEEVSDESGKKLEEVRTLLGCLLFRGDEVYKPIGVLSMGERVRVTLARLILSGCSLLIMDEPTNHLDLPSREAVEEALLQYGGTLLFVSHDRYFLERMATEVWVIKDKKLTCFPYAYHEYMERLQGASDQGGKIELLVLETRLSQLSAELDSCMDDERKKELNQQFLELAREINARKKEASSV